MPDAIGRLAINRASRSLAPGGELDLGFFGGEPLLEEERISTWMKYARDRAAASDVTAQFGLTTNGTIARGAAWALMLSWCQR